MKIEAFIHNKRRVSFQSVSLSQEIHQPKLHGHCHSQPPTAAMKVWGASGLGSVYEAYIALLYTFGGHRGAERQIFPRTVQTDGQIDPAAAVNVFVLPTCFLLLSCSV